jgi:hypothetical protein
MTSIVTMLIRSIDNHVSSLRKKLGPQPDEEADGRVEEGAGGESGAAAGSRGTVASSWRGV